MRNEILNSFNRDVMGAYCDFVECLQTNEVGDGKLLAAGKKVAGELFHFREMMPKPYNDFYYLKNLCLEYAIVGDVFNVLKHHEIEAKRFLPSKDPKPKHEKWIPTLRYRTQVRELLINNKYIDSQGEYSSDDKDVALLSDRIPNKSLNYNVWRTMNFWESVFKKLGWISGERQFINYSVEGFVSRENARVISFKASTDFSTEVEVVTQRYNPMLGTLNLVPKEERVLDRIKLTYNEDGALWIDPGQEGLEVRLVEKETGRIILPDKSLGDMHNPHTDEKK
ncbi:hypothetical protein LX87_05164 [Larkinella arboricola]|uniref:Uncharacterized protein n=1 Tax=Larkinella arboricola TaxID=643671 RepID=A0A327WPE5_LARAB|nr:hypothetical protein [Larkinella arboricola]RAJ92196.1 hypothetical protein LX87_05164 [Larkinella arboricola]